MKINKNKQKKKQIIQFHLIKSKIFYEKESNFLNYLLTFNLSKIVIKLKKSIQIIFKFHKKNKKILFIGIPKLLEQKINSKTNHIAIPKFFNISGIFINKSVVKSLKFKNQLFIKNKSVNFSKLLYKPDLIVTFKTENMDSIIKESKNAKIPLILFNANFEDYKKLKNSVYEVPGNLNFNDKIIDNLFLKIVNSILKK